MTRESGSEARRSPVETTAGSEQRPDHTGVIRRADGREGLTGRVDYRAAIMAVDVNNDTDPILRTRIANACMAVADAENAALSAERDEWLDRAAGLTTLLRAERVISDSRNATIERLWAQLNEATNVPLVMHEPGCSLDTDHKGSCVLGERISGVDECPCFRCSRNRDVAAMVAKKPKP